MGKKGYKHPGHKHPVVAVKPDGSMGGYFEFIRDACLIYGMDRHSITDSCKRGTICFGFRWMYEEEYRKYWLQGRTHELAYKLDPNRDRRTYHWKKGHHCGSNVWSKETKEKVYKRIAEVSRQRAADPNSKWGKGWDNLKPVRCVNTGREYKSIKEAAADVGLRPSHISGAISRGGKVHGLQFVKL